MTEAKKRLKIGEAVVYVDTFKQEHLALVTSVFSGMSDTADGCNLVYVSGDSTKTDTYGRQLERACSVPHISSNPAQANCWKDLGE